MWNQKPFLLLLLMFCFFQLYFHFYRPNSYIRLDFVLGAYDIAPIDVWRLYVFYVFILYTFSVFPMCVQYTLCFAFVFTDCFVGRFRLSFWCQKLISEISITINAYAITTVCVSVHTTNRSFLNNIIDFIDIFAPKTLDVRHKIKSIGFYFGMYRLYRSQWGIFVVKLLRLV